MDYKEEIRKIFENASPEAKRILGETLKIERRFRWQTEHRSLTAEINKDIMNKIKEIVK